MRTAWVSRVLRRLIAYDRTVVAAGSFRLLAAMTAEPRTTSAPAGALAFRYPDPGSVRYAQAEPFAHAVLHDQWDAGLLRNCKTQIDGFQAWDGEKEFYGARKKRYCGNIETLPPAVTRIIHEASSPRFLDWLGALTGESNLLPDPYLEGGGIHRILPGGFLKVHADFNWNERLRLYRRLNVLLYLNPDWQSDWGGALELWRPDLSACVRSVQPRANTMVIFTTDDHSFHGHPQPLACPDGIHRDSIALYYYSPLRPTAHYGGRRKGTDYRPVRDDQFAARDNWVKRMVRRLKA